MEVRLRIYECLKAYDALCENPQYQSWLYGIILSSARCTLYKQIDSTVHHNISIINTGLAFYENPLI